MASNKSDRSGSPSTLSEEGRRELIARQHRALYGPEGSGFSPQGQYNQDSPGHEQGQQSVPGGMRGSSPRGMDPFGMPGQSDNIQQQSNDGKTTSPPNHQHGKAPSPTTADESNHSRTISKSNTAPIPASVGTIGRPSTQHMPAQSLNKRTTSPLPSSLNYGFGSAEQGNDRMATINNNAGQDKNTNPTVGAWGTGSGVWGNKLGTGVWS